MGSKQVSFIDECDFYAKRFNAHKQILTSPVSDNLGIIVTIPAVNEPNLIPSLRSLYDNNRPNCRVEVIVMVNASENAPETVTEQNGKTVAEVNAWAIENNNEWIKTQVCLMQQLAQKHAGAGWARKLAMDEASYRFRTANNPSGIIACFDADSTCATNYLVELERNFADSTVSGCSIYFEHLRNGEMFPSIQQQGILSYELHLRYLTQAMRWAGAPYAFHTVGSSMAVRITDYLKVGGMNRRTAGEDFYFLHKIIPRGRFINIGSTTVYPSSRESDRVPFGTGAAMLDMMRSGKASFPTYDFSAFEQLKYVFSNIDKCYDSVKYEEHFKAHCPPILSEYLASIKIDEELLAIRKQCRSKQTFQIKFLQWFNAFRLIKYLNWSHSEHYKKGNPEDQSMLLLKAKQINAENDISSILEAYRHLDRLPF